MSTESEIKHCDPHKGDVICNVCAMVWKSYWIYQYLLVSQFYGSRKSSEIGGSSYRCDICSNLFLQSTKYMYFRVLIKMICMITCTCNHIMIQSPIDQDNPCLSHAVTPLQPYHSNCRFTCHPFHSLKKWTFIKITNFEKKILFLQKKHLIPYSLPTS